MVERQRPVVVIAGAGRGIGRATAIELARRGYVPVLASRTQAELEETRRLCGGGTVVRVDVSRPAGAAHLVRMALRKHARIDAVVNCAGLAPMVAAAEMDVGLWRAVIETNLSAAFYLWRAVWQEFRRRRAGVMVNISSFASRDPLDGFAAYGAAKAGLNVLSRVLAREGQRFGVRVYTVAPSAVDTRMFRTLKVSRAWPAEQILQAAEVARVVALCVAGDLRYTSGEVIFVSRTA